MKRLIYSLLSLAALFTVASCQPDKLIGGEKAVDDGTLVDATFAVNLGPQTKAFADGTQANQLYAGLYKVVTGGYEHVADTKVAVTGKKGQVTFEKGLRRGESYKVVFWAQHEADGFTSPYTVALNNATPTITVATSGAAANDDLRDAFYGVYETGEVNAAITIADDDGAIKLKRPFAQINILVPNTNIDNTSATTRTSAMTVAGAPNVLNLLTGVASGSVAYEFNSAAISEAAFGTFVSGYQYMAMNYVLPAQDGNGAYNVTFSVVNDGQSVTDKQVTIPLKPNVRTNIVGNIFDENFDFSSWAVIQPEAGELTEINLNVGDAGASASNPVTLSGVGATTSVTPIISRDVTGETPTITVDPPSVAKAVWNPSTKAVDITALANGTATVTVVFQAVTKTYYAEGKMTFFIEVTGVVAQQVATPTFSPAAGEYTAAQSVEIACATEGAAIYYTTDGTDPTAASTAYTAAIAVGETMTIKAIAVKEGMADSEIATAAYTISSKSDQTLTVKVGDNTIGDSFAKTYGDAAFSLDVTGNVGNLSYTSGTESVATIDAQGQITVVGAGSSLITVSAAETESHNAGTKSFTLTVAPKAADLLLDDDEAEVTAGETVYIDYEAETDGVISVASSDENKVTASVDTQNERIVINGVAAGSATLTVSIAAGTNYAALAETQSIAVTVNAPAATGLSLPFNETFSSFDGTMGWSGSVASGNGTTPDNEGWVFENVSGADKAAKFGTTSKLGTATTPAINYSGDATLTFRAGAWNGSSESTVLKLSVSCDGATISNTENESITSVTIKKGEWTSYHVYLKGVSAGFTLTFAGNNASNSRFFLDEVKIVEGIVEPEPLALESISVSGQTSSFKQDDAFVFGGVVTAHYNDASTKDVTENAEFSGYDMSTISESQTVTVSYTEGGMTKTTTYTIKVTDKNAGTDYTSLYTTGNNVTLSGGSNASVVISETHYDAKKLEGRSSKTIQTLSISVPEGTSKVHLFIGAWNEGTASVSVVGGTIDSAELTADAGISNSSPFTLSATSTADFYKVITVTNSATTITITPSGERVLVWGVNAE